MKFPKLLSFVCAVAITIFLPGCEKEDQTLELQKYLDMIVDEAAEGPITWVLDADDDALNAHCHWSDSTIHIAQGVLRRLKSGELDIAQALMIVCHEVGHIGPNGHNDESPYHDEEYADYYGLLLLDELNTDYHLHLDLYDAIKLFLMFGTGDDGVHRPGNVRYAYLKAKLDYWKAHAGETEPGVA